MKIDGRLLCPHECNNMVRDRKNNCRCTLGLSGFFRCIGQHHGLSDWDVEPQSSTPKTNDYPEGWFTHDCRYLVEDIKCDLDLKDGCEYATNDQKCGLIVGRLKQAEYLRSSASKVKNNE